MHLNHRLGYANSRTGYFFYYQSLLALVHNGISNPFWGMSNLSLKMERNIFHCCTGTFFFRNTLSVEENPLAFKIHFVSKRIVLSIFSQGNNTKTSLV